MFNIKFIRYSLANLTLVCCILLIITIGVSLYFKDGAATIYVRQLLAMLVASYLLKYKLKVSDIIKLRTPDLFLSTSITWFYVICICMVPYMSVQGLRPIDAFFEMTSGVTTTGASIFETLKGVPTSLLFWRSITQWLGGIGFVVVGVLILPNLNTGGMKLFKTESSDTEEKTFPHYRDMAFNIFLYYLFLTLACAFTYWYCGMSKLDAFHFSFTTLATGGFTPTDDQFDAILDQYAPASLFLLFAALPFQVFVVAIYKRKPWRIFFDPQIRTYCLLVLVAGFLMATERYFKNPAIELSFFRLWKEALINIFNVISNCGYYISDFWDWGAVTFFLMVVLQLTGGSSGSTAGGLKIFRLNILYLFTKKQFNQVIHPYTDEPILYNNQVVTDDVIKGILFFVVVYSVTALLFVLAFTMTGLNVTQALSATATCITNTGLTFGPNVSDIGTFAGHTDMQKFIDSICMILGRLEFTTLLVLLIPRFWRY